MTTASHCNSALVLLEKRREMFAANFLLALNDEREVAGKLGAGLEISLDRLEVGEVLALVVAGVASEHEPSGDARLERRRIPQVKRLGGLDIVMPVNDKMPLSRNSLPRGVFAMMMGLPSVGQSRASSPILRQRCSSHWAQAFRSWRCCGCAETLGKRT